MRTDERPEERKSGRETEIRKEKTSKEQGRTKDIEEKEAVPKKAKEQEAKKARGGLVGRPEMGVLGACMF